MPSILLLDVMSTKPSRIFVLCCAISLVPGVIYYFDFHSKYTKWAEYRFHSSEIMTTDSTEARSQRTSSDANKNVTGIITMPSNALAELSKGGPTEFRCFQYGTLSLAVNQSCVCRNGWNGANCSVPDAVWSSDGFQDWYTKGLIKRRSTPRTIINGLVFNHELDLLEIRVKELGDAVDYYVIVESNYTYFGSNKPLHLRSNLSAGFLSGYAHKIFPIAVNFYNYGNGDPWAPENYFRSSIWREGQRKLKNIRDDDLFMILDADEIPSRDILIFLKYHDGFGEPIRIRLRWFLYGFFWENRTPVEVGGVCTVAFLREVYGNDSLHVRQMDSFEHKHPSTARTSGQKWTIEGSPPRYAGWHCSWCFDAHGIQVKLAAAQRDDGIRWGDIAEKTDLVYINFLRSTGRYFDNSAPLMRCDANETAPDYLRGHASRFEYLMKA